MKDHDAWVNSSVLISSNHNPPLPIFLLLPVTYPQEHQDEWKELRDTRNEQVESVETREREQIKGVMKGKSFRPEDSRIRP